MNEEMTTANAPVPTTMGPKGKAFGKSYFDCDQKTFDGCYHARSKGQHWKTYLNKNPELSNGIKTFFAQNKKENSVLLRHGNSYLNVNRSSTNVTGYF